jgi:tRNA pseudouridine38-40 synthase
MRIAAGIQYKGTRYSGWQNQLSDKIPSLQAAVESALSSVANQPIQTICAGRTDKGVHAAGQVIHFDTEVIRSEHSWLCGANANLPRDIVVTWVKEASADFHARFSARSRTYRYTVYNSPIRPVLDADVVTWHFKDLVVEQMQKAAEHLIGEHDFTSFRAAGCQANSPIRTIESITLTRVGKYITLEITANAFLYHMVRNIMGALFEVGEGKKPPGWISELLAACDRREAAETAPASGLSLIEVKYPEVFDIY